MASHLSIVGGPGAVDVRGPNGKPNPVRCGEYIIDSLGIRLMGDQPTSYAAGCWQPCRKRVDAVVAELGGLDNTRAFRAEVKAYIKTYAPQLRQERTGRFLAFRDVTADFDAGTLVEHSPDHGATYRINAELNAKADASLVMSFISQIAVTGYEQRLLQLGAYALTRWRALDAIGVIVGPPGSGKSTYSTVLTELLRQPGPESDQRLVSAVSPHSIGTSRFALGAMEDAVLNVVPDLSRADVKSIATIKALSGRDAVMIERKGQDPYARQLDVFLLLMANGLGAWPDAEGALLRRVKFAETQRPAVADPTLTAKLTRPEALSAWASIFVRELWELRQRGFTETDITQAGLAKFRRATNIVPRFISEACVTSPELSIPTARLWLAWKSWSADAKTGTATGKGTFFNAVESEGFTRRKSGVEIFDGLALASDHPATEP